MKYLFRQKIIEALLPKKKEGLTEGAILQAVGAAKKDIKRVMGVVSALEKDGLIYHSKGRYILKGASRYFNGTVVKVARTHGFIRNEKTEEELFVRGRDMLGAVPGDTVLAFVSEFADEQHDSDTAKVVLITGENEGVMTGTVVSDNGKLRLRPDAFFTDPLFIVRWNGNDIHEGDKVRWSIHERADHHSDITADIVSVYGSSEYARNSVDAYIDEKGIETEFSEEALAEAEKIGRAGVDPAEVRKREDLRGLPIFTIDGADTKDIDDAVSIERTENGYRLGVHIADVSHYVQKGTALDKTAHDRGTSIYIADRVIPMLPKQLSNGICSLNPDEDRLAFSCIMDIAVSGEITKFRFAKTVIRSRVKGVYSEVNALLDDTAGDDIRSKYAEVSSQLPVMRVLTETLIKNREGRGAPDIDSKESRIVCDENGVCTDISERTRGFAERMIEEFMLCANNCAARFAMEAGFPFVYRVHESPDRDKLVQLSETLVNLGVDNAGINEKSTAGDLSAVLERVKDDPKAPVINNLVLRSMMKAKYSEEPLGHFGLVMKEYSHFTSPIRRLADFSIHRILTDAVAGMPTDRLIKKYQKFAHEQAYRASITELTAVAAERDCDKFYMAEFMKEHIGEEFDGYISGVTGAGFFVELPSTVEGRVDTMTLPVGTYELSNDISLVETLSNTAYTIGDAVRVKCAAADVGSGMIDLELLEHHSEDKH
ncbi:MAG: ribonuclease R [Ruminiclostridium sp.]|nr:ribonuclease R [Ruminiclostridium sp.]